MTNECEVLIIGCGILGASTAYSLIKCNVSTIVLEQYSTYSHENGGSFGDTRCWRVTYTDPIYANMMKKSLKLWKEIENITSTKLISYCGGLDFGPKSSKSMKDIVNTLKINNCEYQILSSQETMKRFYPIKLPQNYYSIYIPNDHGTIKANKALQSIIKCIKQLNGSDDIIKYNSKVIRIEIMDNNNKYKYKVYTNNKNEIYKTNNIICSCGAYKLPQIFSIQKQKRLNIIDMIQSIALNIVYFKPMDNDNNNNNICKYPAWAEYDDSDICKWYGQISMKYTPFGNIYCMKIGDDGDNDTDNNSYQHIIEYMKKRFNTKWKVFECKRCYISRNIYQKNDCFTMDKIIDNENIFVMHGYSHSFKHGPELGNIMKNFVINNQKPNKIFQIYKYAKL